jgi:hypothetical protein
MKPLLSSLARARRGREREAGQEGAGVGWSDKKADAGRAWPSRVRVLSPLRDAHRLQARPLNHVQPPGCRRSASRRRRGGRETFSEVVLVWSKLPRAALRDNPFRRSSKHLVDALMHFGGFRPRSDEQGAERCCSAVGRDLVVVRPAAAALVFPMAAEFHRDGSSDSSWIDGGRKKQRGLVDKRASLFRHRDRLAPCPVQWESRGCQPRPSLRG